MMQTAAKVHHSIWGSVKPNNAKELMGQPDVDGALVGGRRWKREVLLTSSRIPSKLGLASLFIGLLTAVLVLDCVLLILLVLVQLPKKEAGAGWRWGGAADALFGAGAGNPLTKITKFAAITSLAR